MPAKLYRNTEDDSTFVSDFQVHPSWGTSKEVTVDDVTIDELINACSSKLEDANYHRITNLPERIAQVAKDEFSEDAAKRFLWRLITEHGLMLGIG